MRPIATVVSTLSLVAVLAPSPALAQSTAAGMLPASLKAATPGGVFDLPPNLTKEEFTELTADLGALLRFRQLGDTRTLGRGGVDLGVQFGSAPIDDAQGLWNHMPRFVGRFGVHDRVDVGAWGGVNADANFGLLGGDAKIALLTEGAKYPVSVSVRPSLTMLIGPSEVIAGNTSVDLTVSRAFGAWSPYAGVAASSSGAIERSENVDLDPVSAGATFAYAGVAYHYRGLVAAAEIEKGTVVSYAFRIGTRF